MNTTTETAVKSARNNTRNASRIAVMLKENPEVGSALDALPLLDRTQEQPPANEAPPTELALPSFDFARTAGITLASLEKIEADFKAAKGRIQPLALKVAADKAAKGDVKTRAKNSTNAFLDDVFSTSPQQVAGLAKELVRDHGLSEKDANCWIVYTTIGAAFLIARQAGKL